MENLITVEEFAAKFNITSTTVYNWIAKDIIKAREKYVGLKKMYCIPESEITKIKELQKEKVK